MAGKRMPRVLMTADTVGGVWTYAVTLARELAARGTRVAIATMGAPVAPHQRAELAGTRFISLHESEYRLEWMQDCAADVEAAGQWLLALAHELKPDVVHLNQFAFGALPFTAPTLLVAHSCVASWWRAVHGVAAPKDRDTYRRWVRRGLEGADLVAAPTRAMLATLADNYDWHGAGLVLSNGADGSHFAPAAKEPFILAAGRFWDAAKNLSALEAVAPAIAWPVRIAGNATQPDGGTRLTQGVECLGALCRDDLADQMARASIYALPARYEPFGLSVLEAALSGCALVLGDIPSLREIWGPAAVYVAPDDHAGLRAALQRLIASPRERTRLGQAALARARHFTPERHCEAYLAAYARLSPRFVSSTTEELACA